MEEAALDDIIDRLLDVRNGRPGKQVQLTEMEIRQLCLTAKEIFMGQPNLLELEAPIKICGVYPPHRQFKHIACASAFSYFCPLPRGPKGTQPCSSRSASLGSTSKRGN